MASLFASFSAAPVEVEVKLAGEDERKQVEVKGDKDQKVMCPVFYDGESVSGQVSHTTQTSDMLRH
jgi:vacuolar protein sorting-associated protein 26